MARLPIPGSDQGTWGEILNDFLSQAHDGQGHIKDDAVTTSAVANESITEAQLAPAVQTKLNATAPVTSVAGKTGAVTLDADDVSGTLASADNLSDLANAATARSNLGLGGAATQNVGTIAGTVAAGNDSRITGAVQSSIVTTKGDVLAATGNAAITRVGVGTNDQVLVADSAQTAGVKWSSRIRQPWQFYVADYGAVGDNSTDDTAAIQACVDAATTYATANEYYCEVIFDPKTYLLSSALALTGNGGNPNGGWKAHIRLPYLPPAGRKLTFVLKGGEEGTGFLHWLQETPQRSGTVLRTTLTGQTLGSIESTNSIPPSIVAAPRLQSGQNFSNILVVVDGIMGMAPQNPSMTAWDFFQAAQVHIKNASAQAFATVSGQGGNPNISSIPNGLGIGLILPKQGNNDQVLVDNFNVEGFQTGVSLSEHAHFGRLATIYCADCIFIQGTGTFIHGFTIDSFSAEASTDVIEVAQTVTMSVPVHISAMHAETITGNHVNDAGGRLKGEIHWHSIAGNNPVVNGAGGVRIINEKLGHGAATPPAVPASTVAHTNTFFRDATVTITGGTVTDITVDGTTTGLTSGTVIIPSGKTITLTYSAAPTWAWWLL